ncbi:MAG: hypothetical protein C0593_05730 [Marinilabiliales bacterium]|mgnify:CR=1 FL=1|nr:MAG: hypothetical protein C0593_05730 [Marinilabiliales bacterium]
MKKKTLKSFSVILMLFSVLAFTSSCYRTVSITGNYDLITETRDINNFDKISLEGFMDVEYIPSDYYEVKIEAESNLIPYIETSVKNSRLEISVYDHRNLRNNYRIVVRVYAPDLKEYSLSGSGDFYCENLVNESFELNISGSGDVALGIDTYDLELSISGSGDAELWGIADDAELSISGSGRFNAYDLKVNDCKAKISGTGNMYLWVIDNLDINITGSGSIYYTGEPSIDATITGTGAIIPVSK